jgi:GNAT superfamily N-acetyltransferase
MAVKSDAEEITRVINAAFAPAEKAFIDGDRVTLADVLDYLERGVFLIAEDKLVIKGCVYLEQRGDERTYLGLLSVDPDVQGTGVGSLLMEAGENRSRTRKSLFIDILTVNHRTELKSFYKNRGYNETGTSAFPTDIPTKLPCHFINMTKELSLDPNPQ